MATLPGFIGAGGLHDPIITEHQLNDVSLILSGAVPGALLVLLASASLAAQSAASLLEGSPSGDSPGSGHSDGSPRPRLAR